MNKEEKIRVLRDRRLEKESKLRSKLDIYADVRPKDAQGNKERVKKEYLMQILRHSQKQSAQIERIYTASIVAKY